MDEDVKFLIDNTNVLLPFNTKRILKYSIYFPSTRPLACLKSFIFLITHQYERSKSFTNDRLKFYKADIVKDNVSRILVPPNDEIALAEAMIRLINDYDLRAELGENARRRVE